MDNLWGSLAGTQLGAAVIITWVINRLKKSNRCTWVGTHTEQANRIAGMVAALACSLGLVFNSTGNAEVGWQIGITVPPLGQLIKTVFDVAGGVGMQYGTYRLTTLPTYSTPPDVMIVDKTRPGAPPKTTVDVFPSPVNSEAVKD